MKIKLKLFHISLFPPLAKSRNVHKIFQKDEKQNKCAIICLNDPNFYYFSKSHVFGMKNLKNCKKKIVLHDLKMFFLDFTR